MSALDARIEVRPTIDVPDAWRAVIDDLVAHGYRVLGRSTSTTHTDGAPATTVVVVVYLRGPEVDHGLVDDRGRRLGGTVEASVTATGIRVRLRAMRDGVKFGAITPATWCERSGDVVAYAARALAAQHKRYAKKFGAP